MDNLFGLQNKTTTEITWKTCYSAMHGLAQGGLKCAEEIRKLVYLVENNKFTQMSKCKLIWMLFFKSVNYDFGLEN